MKKFIIENWFVVAGLIGSAVTYLGTVVYERQKAKNTVKSTELENIKTVRSIEKEILNDMQIQVDKLIEMNAYLRKINNEQAKELNQYKFKYGELI